MVCVRCKKIKDGQLVQVIDNDNDCKFASLTRITRSTTPSSKTERSQCHTSFDAQLVNSEISHNLCCCDIGKTWKFIPANMIAKQDILPILRPHYFIRRNDDTSESEPDNIEPPPTKKRKLNHAAENANQSQTIANEPETPKDASDLSCAGTDAQNPNHEASDEDGGGAVNEAETETQSAESRAAIVVSSNADIDSDDSPYDFEADIARRRTAKQNALCAQLRKSPSSTKQKQPSSSSHAQLTELSMFQRLHRFRQQQRFDMFPDNITVQIWFNMSEIQAEQLAIRYFAYRRNVNENAHDRKPFILLQSGQQLRCTKCSEKSCIQHNMEAHVIREHGDSQGIRSLVPHGKQAISDVESTSETENFHEYNAAPCVVPVNISHISMNENEMRDNIPPLSPVLPPMSAPPTNVSENTLEPFYIQTGRG